MSPIKVALKSVDTFDSESSKEIVMKCLPSFIIAGAMKCGTGELMKWLNLNPFLRSGTYRLSSDPD
jgi:hypothetical protein